MVIVFISSIHVEDLVELKVICFHPVSDRRRIYGSFGFQCLPIEDYVNQPYNKKHQLFKYVAEICKTKAKMDYVGFSAVPVASASDKGAYLYFNNTYFHHVSAKKSHGLLQNSRSQPVKLFSSSCQPSLVAK
ncbi:hypothetical protein DKX38_021591 [Salix brachista]|uniref:Uncharacterized protein n=1 Tax=Salix brachista TaxID=2182728 RepID=A0A5N5KAK1_9ROSI|nr:hypothetical protein DKX38_021591 [Salix brachista]